MSARAPAPPVVHYPDSDGEPMADNSVQYRWIATLKWSAEAQFAGDANVFVAGDHLIYAVRGDAKARQAPDVYVAFGRPKEDRGSYKVWEEGGVFPQVIFEVWSPNNRFDQMQKKFAFYERHGAEEYYIVYPEFPSHVEGYRREGDKLAEIADLNDYVSPRLGWRFWLDAGELRVLGPDGRQLRDPAEVAAERDAAVRERDAADAQRQTAERERAAADAQRRTAERERADADAQRQTAERSAAAQQERAAKLAARLRELGVDPDAV